MSIHRSLRGIDTLKGERSVLTRYERVHAMLKDGRLDEEGGSPFGLPKMRTHFKVVSGKKGKAPEGEDEANPAESSEGGEG